MSKEPAVKPMMSPKRDLKRMSKNSQAVVGELREFLANMKGKSPKEMMGSVAESNLFQSMFLATGIMAVLLVAFTAIPYALKENQKATQATEETTTPQGGDSAPDQEQKGDQPAGTQSDKTSSPEQSTADKLGIGEEKKTDPKSNPLDGTTDDLLDGLDDL